tara:strand:- start:9627 stop:10472 length:846 start_codon:yes stop_codon:yes gene_type:complete
MIPGQDQDPGLEGIVPFTFDCHRCGRCCTAGAGHVWLAEGESERMAARLGMEHAAFERLHVRTVAGPDGELRRSLRERHEGDHGGRCSLLEGTNACTVYEDRPEHCRTFPYWDGVLNTESGFEAAQTTCPGITVEPTDEQRAEAFAALEALYAEVDGWVSYGGAVCIGRGTCCRFEEAGHELYATPLEADYAASRHPEAPPPEAPGRCPYHRGGVCTAREGRPLGCRTYFCDPTYDDAHQAGHERFLAAIRDIERATGYPSGYARFPELAAARGIGTSERP